MVQKIFLQIGLAFFCASGFAATDNSLKIVVDPGHGGVDDGAVRAKVREADIALQIATELAKVLRDHSHTVVMTRQSDKAVSLKQRTQIAESEKADLFISIHANANEDERAKGVEFYFQNTLPADEETAFLASKENQAVAADPDQVTDSDVSQILADLQRNYKLQSSFELTKILAESWSFNSASPQRNRLIRQAPFYVISQTTMPSVLVEVGFVSHKLERQLLTQKSHQHEIAMEIAKAVEQFKEQIPLESASRSLASP